MKRLSSLLLLLFGICICASAQFRWGPQIGGNYSKYRFRQHLISVEALPGFSAGVMGEMMFPGIGFGIDFGLTYEMRGSKIHFGEREIWKGEFGTENCYIHELQVPLNLRFKYTNLNGIERKIAPLAYVGPVFCLNIGHNKVGALDYTGGSLLLQCGLGVELFEHYQISGGYYWGLTKEWRTKKLDDFSAKPKGWRVNIAYLF